MLPACHLTPRLQPPRAPATLPTSLRHVYSQFPHLSSWQAAITRGRAARGPAPPLKGSRAPGPIRVRHVAEEGHVGSGWGGGWARVPAVPRPDELCVGTPSSSDGPCVTTFCRGPPRNLPVPAVWVRAAFQASAAPCLPWLLPVHRTTSPQSRLLLSLCHVLLMPCSVCDTSGPKGTIS